MVDQFEELFRYQDYAGREEAEAFVALLIESARTAEFPIYVVVTMRSEYLGACALIDGLAEELNAGMYLTPRMSREQCREAIVGPARVCGLEIDDALVNRLLNDLALFAPWEADDVRDQEDTQLDRLVRRADQLPLLQYTLNRMWLLARERLGTEKVKLGLADYKGLSFALNEHADQIFHELDKRRLPVEKIFRALTFGSTIADAVRQPTRLDRLVAICDGDEAGVRAVVDIYRAADCNFLLPEVDPQKPLGSTTVIDISHESLIRQWKRLSVWLALEAAAAQQWRRLNDRFALGEPLRGRELANLIAWRDEVKPNPAWARRYGGDYPTAEAFLQESERVDRRRRWMRTGTAVAVFAIVLTAALVALYQWRAADASLAKAEIERGRAEEHYATAKNILRNLTSFTERAGANMPVAEVTEMFLSTKDTLNKLAAADADDLELLGVQARLLDKFADIYQQNSSYYDLTLKVAGEANSLFRRLIEREPGNLLWPRHLSMNLGKIGDLKLQLNDAGGAEENYREALAIDRSLARRESGNEDHRRQVAIGLVKIGDLLRAKDDAGAQKAYEEALEIRRELAALYWFVPIYRREVSTTLDKIGNLKGRLNDLPGALQSYQEELEIDRQITSMMFAGELMDYKNISFDLGQVARLLRRLGRRDEALAKYEEKIRVDGKMFESDPYDSQLRRGMATAWLTVGELQLSANDTAAAKKSYESAFTAAQNAAEIARTNYNKEANAAKRKAVLDAYSSLAFAALLTNRPDVAAQYADAVLKLDSSQIDVAINRGHAYLLQGRYNDAKAIYEARKDTRKSNDADATYASDIRDDFEIFRKLGLATRDVDRMTKELGIGRRSS